MSNKDKDFVHLHVHSDFSLLDGCCRMDRLMERAVELGMSAMALTDHGNLFGTVSFVKQAEKHGIKPIIGCEGYLVTDHKNDEKPGRRTINLTTWDYWQRILKAIATFPKWFPMPMSMAFTIDLEQTWRLLQNMQMV